MCQSQKLATKFTSIKLYVLFLVSSVFLASCGGSSGGDFSSSTLLMGSQSAATEAASCTLRDANGNQVAQGNTNSEGIVSVSASIPAGVVTLECHSGTYKDEFTGNTVTLSASNTLKAISYYSGSGDFTIIASPLSQMSYNRILSRGTLTADTITTENVLVAELFGFPAIGDVTLKVPTNVNNVEPSSSTAEGNFGIALAVVSQLTGPDTATLADNIDDLSVQMVNTTTFADTVATALNEVINDSASSATANITSSNADATTITTNVGSITAAVTNVIAPSISVSASTAQVYVVNTAINNLVYNSTATNGGITECSIDALPAGLQLNGATALTTDPTIAGECVISGTPSAVKTATDYTLTVGNAVDIDSAVMSITINPEAPSVADLSTQTLTKNTPATIAFTNSGGAISTCSIDATSTTSASALTAAGLSLNTATCEITGTPNTVTTLNIVVAATNETATDIASVSLIINDEAPNLTTIATKEIFAIDIANTITFANTGGGTLIECSVSPSLPAGLSIDRDSTHTTCEITGSATTQTPVTNYTVTAVNATDDSNADVEIEVVNTIPVDVVALESTFTEDSGSVAAFRIETNEAPSSDLTGTLVFTGDTNHASAVSAFTIAAGTTSTDLTVALTGNDYPNSIRTFSARVSTVSDATYGTGLTGSIDITDNDANYDVSISATNTPITEADNATLIFTISTDRNVATNDIVTITVDYAAAATTADVSGTTDFSAIPPTEVTISAGENSTTLEFPIINNTAVELTEYVSAAISAASNAHGRPSVVTVSEGVATIHDDDIYTLSITKTQDGGEPDSDGTFSISVTPANATGADITGTIDYTGSTAVNNTDYQNALTSFIIADGASSTNITIDAIDDGINVDGDKILTATIGNISASSFATAIDTANADMTLSDDDGYVVSITKTQDAAETGTDAIFNISLSSTNVSGSPITGSLIYDGSATSGSDYNAGPTTYSIANGEDSQTITLSMIDDTAPEVEENISITLGAPSEGSAGTNNVATATLEADDDEYQVSIAQRADGAEDGADAEFVVSVTPANTSGGNIVGSITFTSGLQDDFSTAFPTQYTIADGASTHVITLAVENDTEVENLKTLVATITNNEVVANTAIPSSIITTDNAASLTITDNDVYTVSVVVIQNGTEDGANVQFTVNVDPINNTGNPITGNISFSDNSAVQDDFNATTFLSTFFIRNDASTDIITLTVNDDNIVEDLETLTATISDVSASSFTTEIGTASVDATITDNDGYVVSITKTQDATEAGTEATFRIDLSSPNISGNPITGDLTYDGSATSGSDYNAGPTTYSIANDATSQIITLSMINDATPEVEENISITLGEPSEGSVGTNSVATATLEADNDSYQVSIAPSANGTEGGAAAEFTVSVTPANTSGGAITGDITFDENSAVVADFSTAFPTQYTIADGASTDVITLAVSDDSVVENAETLIATIANNTVAANTAIPSSITTNNAASLTITDNDAYTVSIAATQDGTEGSTDDAEFTISVTPANTSGGAITGNITYSDSAVQDDFGTTFPVDFSIANNESTHVITLAVNDDSIVENTETLIATISDISASSFATAIGTASADMTLNDNDGYVVSITKTQDATEAGTEATFRIDLSSPNISGNPITGDLTYDGSATSGSDYNAGPTTYSIANDATSQIITLSMINDATPEVEENISITLGEPSEGSVGTNSVATATLEADNDSYQVSIAPSANGTEGGAAAEFTVSVTPANTSGDAITGDITFDENSAVAADFSTAFPTQYTIADGASTHVITLAVSDDSVVENAETLIATIANNEVVANADIPSSITTNNAASLTITDNDAYTVSIAVTQDGTEGSTDDAEFTISVTPANTSGGAITGNITYSDSAVQDDFGTTFPVDFSIANNESTHVITLAVNDDSIVENTETLIATISDISASSFATAIGTASANMTLNDDDGYVVSITSTQDATEAGTEAIFNISLSSPNISGDPITGNLTYDGSATSGSDYNAGPTTYSIASGEDSQTITLSMINDATPEVEENISITLGEPSEGSVGTNSVATATLEADNDEYRVNIALRAGGTEDGADAELVVSVTPANTSGGAITGGLSYSANSAVAADFSTAFPTQYTIADGTSTHVITLAVSDDDIVENAETLTTIIDNSEVAANTNIPSSVIASQNAATLTITDNDAYTVSIAATQNGTEDGTAAEFTVSVTPTNISGGAITGNITYSDDSAVADDFGATLPLTFSIANDESTDIITLAVNDDNVVEDLETLTATISDISASSFATAIGTASVDATITDNDDYVVSITKTQDATEAGTNATFNISLSSPNISGNPITGNLTYDGSATSGSDYNAGPTTYSIADDATDQIITLSMINDTAPEVEENISITLSAPSEGSLGTNSVATATLTADNDEYVTSIQQVNGSSFAEGVATSPTFRVVSDIAVSADTLTFVIAYTGAAASAADITTPISVVIPAGGVSATFTLGIVDDLALESDESVTLTIDTVTSAIGAPVSINGANNDTTITIADNDGVGVEVAVSGNTSEDGTTASMTVVLSAVPTDDVTTSFTINDITEHLFEGSTAVTNQTILSDTQKVTALTPDTIFNLTSSDSDSFVNEGNDPAVFYFDIITGAFTGDNEILMESGATAVGIVIYQNDADLIMNAGNDNNASDLTATGVFSENTRYAVIVELTNNNGVTFYVAEQDGAALPHTIPQVATGTWVGGTSWSGSDSGGWGQAGATGVANVSGAVAPGNVTYTNFSGTFNEARFYQNTNKDTIWTDSATVITTVFTALNWDQTQTFTIEGQSDGIVDLDVVGTIATAATSADSRYNGITVADTNITNTNIDVTLLADFASSSSNGLESVATTELTVQLSSAGGNAVDVDYAVHANSSATNGGIDYTTLVADTLTIDAGSTVGTITLAGIVDDSIVEDTETIVVVLSNPNGAILGTNQTHTYSITDNDTAQLSFDTTLSNGDEGTSSVELTVNLSNQSASNVTVDFAADASSDATATTDYTLAGSSLTINAGDTVGTISLTVVQDTIVEGVETVVVALSNPSGATLGTNQIHTYSIISDDTPSISRDGASVRTEVAGVAIDNITFTNGGGAGAITGCTTDNTLPASLSLNATTCEISGTADNSSASTLYTLTASNLDGTSTASVTLSVAPATPTSFALSVDDGVSNSDNQSTNGLISVVGIESSATLSYSTDTGATFVDSASNNGFTLAQDTYGTGTIIVRQVNNGLTSGELASTVQYVIAIDTTAPNPAVVTSSAAQSNTTPVITGSAEDLANVIIEFSFDGSAYTYTTTVSGGNWSATIGSDDNGNTPSFVDGSSFTYTVVVRDFANNTSGAITRNLVIDTTAPVLLSNSYNADLRQITLSFDEAMQVQDGVTLGIGSGTLIEVQLVATGNLGNDDITSIALNPDADNKELNIVHSSSVTVNNDFIVTVNGDTLENEAGIALATTQTTIVATAPLITNSTLRINQGETRTVTTAMIDAVDVNTLANDLVFTVANINESNYFAFEGVQTTTFTLEAIQAGSVTFTHANATSTVAPTFDIGVSDGTTTIDPSPADIAIFGLITTTNMVARWDAHNITNGGAEPADGASVATWNDTSGSTNTHNATGADNVTYDADGINGEPALLFAGENAFTVANSTDINISDRWSNYSLAVVFKTGSDVNSTQAVYEQGGSSRGYSFVVDAGNLYAGVWNRAEWDLDHQYKSVNFGPVATNTAYVLTGVHNSGNGSDATNLFQAYLNGTLVTQVDHVDDQYFHNGSVGIGQMYLDSVNPNGDAILNDDGIPFTGHIGEMILWFDHPLSASEVELFAKYAFNAWNMTVAPVIDLNGDDAELFTFSASITGNQAVNIADTDAYASDSDGERLNELTLVIDNALDGSDESLRYNATSMSFTDAEEGNFTIDTGTDMKYSVVANSGTNFTITISNANDGTMTLTDVTDLVQNLQYQNTASGITLGDRRITFDTTDTDSQSNSVSSISTITVN